MQSHLNPKLADARSSMVGLFDGVDGAQIAVRTRSGPLA